MHRRLFQQSALALLPSLPLAGMSGCTLLGTSSVPLPTQLRTIETNIGGRLGVAVIDTAVNRLAGLRLDERFPMCSTFKWLAAALVLVQVDNRMEALSRRVYYGPDMLVQDSPVTQAHVGSEGMSMAALCEAAIAHSDNTAGNLLLRSVGGPQAVTSFARSLGDLATRLDRWEPDLNDATPRDPRDTTTPRMMARLLQLIALGPVLSEASRAQLVRWLQANRTNTRRLAAGLPAGWQVGSQTGTGQRGTTNDVGLLWPPGRSPIIVAAFLTECDAQDDLREGALAAVAAQARAVIRLS